ncbi:MAG: cysteine desulfurase family protein, partial [Bacillota bacterium]
IYFTAGGTESNNLLIKGVADFYKNRGRHLITTSIEHASVYNVFKSLEKRGYRVSYLQPDARGIIDPEELKQTLSQETILVSIMHVNNELGSIQPIRQAGEIIKQYNPEIIFHVDAVQSLGKLRFQPGNWPVDAATFSAHKIHGPKGIGALYLKQGVELTPLFEGGGQEQGLRSGTENVPGIAGLAEAVRELPRLTELQARAEVPDRLRGILIEELQEKLHDAHINSPLDRTGAPHLLNLSFPGIKGEVLVHALEQAGIYVSTGSACHSRNKEDNRVLKAIGLPPELAEGTIRISLCPGNSGEELRYTTDRIKEMLETYF